MMEEKAVPVNGEASWFLGGVGRKSGCRRHVKEL